LVIAAMLTSCPPANIDAPVLHIVLGCSNSQPV